MTEQTDRAAGRNRPTPPVTLRPAVAQDAPRVAEIWRKGWADGHLGFVPDALVAARTPESFDRRAAALVEATTVAVVAGVVAGFVMVGGDEVEEVYVAAEHRGTGVADVLLDEAERLVRATGHTTAWLAVVPGNARARRFYERRGWGDEGAFDHVAGGAGTPIVVPARRYVKQLTR